MSSTKPFTPEACPRCGSRFECGAASGLCDCFELKLSPALQAELALQWPGQCLCLRCLRELSSSALPSGA